MSYFISTDTSLLRSFFRGQNRSFTLRSLSWRTLLLVSDIALLWEIVSALSICFDRSFGISSSFGRILALSIPYGSIVMRDLGKWIEDTGRCFGNYLLFTNSCDRRPTTREVAILLQSVYDVVEYLVVLHCVQQMHSIHQGTGVGRVFLHEVLKCETLMDQSWHLFLNLSFARSKETRIAKMFVWQQAFFE